MSLTAAQLKHEGLIDYSRGVIHIRDVKGLEKKACECYAVVENYLDDFLEYDGGIPGEMGNDGAGQ
jgi:hypothetical protein